MDNIMIGIDFGTTNTSISYMRYNNTRDTFVAECFSIKSQNYIPTVITYKDSNNYWIGDEAIQWSYKYPKNSFSSIKSYINNNRKILSQHLNKSEVDIIADFLKLFKEKISIQVPLNTKIDGIVMGIPIGFTDINKDTYLKALVKAGFYSGYDEAYEKSIFVSEPIAAALDYNLALKDDKKVMVFDFGGGTLDIAIMNMRNINRTNEINEHEVISKEGNLKLGGNDFDRAILENIVVEKYGMRKLKRALNITSFDAIMTVREGIDLMKAIRTAKEELSGVNLSNISVLSGNLELDIEITREEYELSIKPYIEKIKGVIRKCLNSANDGLGILPEEIDVVVLAGGSSLTPLVQETLFEIFGRNKVKVHGNAMTSISRGLALRGYNKIETAYSDILEHSYGIKMKDEKGIGVIISDILKKGQKIKEINNNYYEEFELVNDIERMNFFKVILCEDKKEIGTARIPIDFDLMANSKFRLYFNIDESLEKLELSIFDKSREQMIDIPYGERYILLNRKGV